MSRLIVVSNRLPVTILSTKKEVSVRESSGGLVTALKEVFVDHPGAWIGWTGTSFDEQVVRELAKCSLGMKLCPVFLTKQQQDEFYSGFSNEIIWPLFHDLQSRCNFDPSYWKAYVDVNRHFSDAVIEEIQPGDFVWVHDYHLALAGSMLRQQNRNVRTAYFQHIPFPSVDIFEKLPWRSELIKALLSFEIVGFQTDRDLRNFTACVRAFGVGRIRRWQEDVFVEHSHGKTKAATFPISIDYCKFASEAGSIAVEQKLAEIQNEYRGRHVVLGVDRLDYTKGIPERLRAYSRALELYPELRRNVTLVQVVVPSRENIPKYQDLKVEIERLVGEINGRFTDGGWVPIHFVYRHLERAELLAYYRLADVALITPLKDGMNLVAKEYCAANLEETGVLILSEFAGAAAQMRAHALVVNPNDFDAVARTIKRAVLMPEDERRTNMTCLREIVRQKDVHRWTDDFLQAWEAVGREKIAGARSDQALRSASVAG